MLALKNNLLYDLALAPNIEIEIPVGKRWSVNMEYKSPWWSNSSKEICYQLISGGIESRYWLGNRELHNRLNGHFFGLYIEEVSTTFSLKETATKVNITVRQDSLMDIPLCCHDIWHWNSA